MFVIIILFMTSTMRHIVAADAYAVALTFPAYYRVPNYDFEASCDGVEFRMHQTLNSKC